MSIFAKTELKLTLMCLATFATVLIVFAMSVLSIFTNQITEETRADIKTLADAVVASIDFDEDETKNPASAEPDLIVSALPESSSQLLNEMKLEWFDYRSKLTATKGNFKVTAPLNPSEGFAELKDPHGIIFTRSVVDNGHLLGYVRVAQPLDKQERSISDLKIGLLLGTLAALLVSGIGTAFIVRQSMNPIFKNMQKLRQFTSDASHELRNPIAAILTNSAVALKHAEGMRSGDKEKFESIDLCGKQMQRLVENLLLLERFEHVQRTASHANLRQTVESCLRNLQWSSTSKNINIELAISPDIELDCDPDDLYRIISNLVENAIRYSTQNGAVSLKAEVNASTTTLRISDHGIGIAENDLEKVYDRFWRADKVRTFDKGGEGLGLAIVNALIERYRGSISVQSEVDKGTTFNVTLPNSSLLKTSEGSEKFT